MVNGEWLSLLTPGAAILLVAGDKSGGSQKRFYRDLLRKADQRFGSHLSRLKKKGNSDVS
jgi:hypothetical protein